MSISFQSLQLSFIPSSFIVIKVVYLLHGLFYIGVVFDRDLVPSDEVVIVGQGFDLFLSHTGRWKVNLREQEMQSIVQLVSTLWLVFSKGY